MSCKVILKNIVKEIQGGSSFYSIIVDETHDVFNTEQISICVHYISDNCIKERFLEFIKLKDLHAKALANNIQHFCVLLIWTYKIVLVNHTTELLLCAALIKFSGTYSRNA